MVDLTTTAADQIASETADIVDEIDNQTDQTSDSNSAVNRVIDDLSP